ALPLPRWIRCSNVVRSSAVSSTTYFFFGIVTGAPQWHWSRVYHQLSYPSKSLGRTTRLPAGLGARRHQLEGQVSVKSDRINIVPPVSVHRPVNAYGPSHTSPTVLS